MEALLPVELGSGKIKFAQGIKAGRWVFASGLMGQDFVNGIAPDVLAERMPHGWKAGAQTLLLRRQRRPIYHRAQAPRCTRIPR